MNPEQIKLLREAIKFLKPEWKHFGYDILDKLAREAYPWHRRDRAGVL